MMQIVPFPLKGSALYGCDINSEQDTSLFAGTYFRHGIVLRNICHKESNNCAYIVPN